MINRRELLLGSGAVALSSGLIGRNKPAMAATEQGWGVYLDGTSGFTNSGGIAGMAQSTVGLFVYSWRSPSPPSSQSGHTVMQFGFPLPTSGSGHICTIDHLWNGTNAIAQIVVSGNWSPGDGNTYPNQSTWAASANIDSFFDGNWHTNIITMDTINNLASIIIDGSNRSLTRYSNSGEKFVSFQRGVNLFANGGYSFIGDVADVGVFVGGPFIDPATITDNLYDIERGYAVRNASDGSGIVPGRRPQIWLSGPPEYDAAAGKWMWRNRAAGTWTWPGTYNDTNPTSNFTAVGNVTSASLPDAFEPNSPF